MGRWHTEDLDREIARGFIVEEFGDGDADLLDYLAAQSTADDGRNP